MPNDITFATPADALTIDERLTELTTILARAISRAKPPKHGKAKGGRLLRCPRHHNDAATVAQYCSTVHMRLGCGSPGPERNGIGAMMLRHGS